MNSIVKKALLVVVTIATTATAIAIAAPAHAVFIDGPTEDPLLPTQIDFEGFGTGPFTTLTQGIVTINGTGDVAIRPPSTPPNNFLQINSGSVEFNFGTNYLNSFGFTALAATNNFTVQFFDDANSLGTFTAAQIGFNGSFRNISFFPSPIGSNYDFFNRIVIANSTSAFQIDDIAFTEVPTPALLPGLVGLGLAAWRKRNQISRTEV
jgi:hypothetical protein